MEQLVAVIEELKKRIEALERLVNLKNIEIPADGKFVVDIRSSDPVGQNGRIYYNSTAHKFKGYENGTWKTFTTT